MIVTYQDLLKKNPIKSRRSGLTRRLSKKMLHKLLSGDPSIKEESKFKPDDQSSNFDGVRGTDIIGDNPPDHSSDSQ